jgi:HlyD family secretion protein
MKTDNPWKTGIVLFVIPTLMLLAGCSGGSEPAAMLTAQMAAPHTTAVAGVTTISDWYTATGTVRPRTESRIESLVSAQVLDVSVQPGERVTKGQLIMRLDDRQLAARLEQAAEMLKTAEAGRRQARQSVVAAEAAYGEALAEYNRVKTYFEKEAATARDLEQAKSRHLQARAGLERARQGLSAAAAGIRRAREVVKEADIALGYTRILAPGDGIVLERHVDPGDLALPGKPLVSIRTAESLRLEAFVREGLIGRIRPGDQLRVSVATLGIAVDARVEEVVPYADPQTRTFLVKTLLPPMEGLYPGMFGKLLIPAVERDVVRVPRQAVRRVGQLELMTVKTDQGWQRRFVKTGRAEGEQVEILSGLAAGETYGWGKAQL